jgi:hypothetical protein
MHSTLYPKKCDNCSAWLTHTTINYTHSATTKLRSSMNLQTLHGTLAKAKSPKQNDQRIRTNLQYHIHLYITKSLINKQPGKTHYPQGTIAPLTHQHSNTQIWETR